MTDEFGSRMLSSELRQVTPYLFVEVGHGGRPAFFGANGEMKEKFRGVQYIGFDISQNHTFNASSLIESPFAEHLEGIQFHPGTINDSNLSTGTVDEVYIANVFAETFSAQMVEASRASIAEATLASSATSGPQRNAHVRRAQELLDPLRIHQAPGPQPFTKWLEQMAIIRDKLKSDGQLTIVETDTPTDINLMRRSLDEQGFEIEKFITKEETEAWATMVTNYYIREGHTRPQDKPYIIIVRKKSLEPTTELVRGGKIRTAARNFLKRRG